MKDPKYWTELIGFVAVFISLVFVGYEIRESTLATKAANHYALLELVANQVNTILESEELSYISKEMVTDAGLAKLTPLQKSRASSIRTIEFNIWETAYYNHSQGQLDDELWDAWDRYHKSILNAGYWETWRTIKHGFSVSFSAHVDDTFAEAGFRD